MNSQYLLWPGGQWLGKETTMHRNLKMNLLELMKAFEYNEDK